MALVIWTGMLLAENEDFSNGTKNEKISLICFWLVKSESSIDQWSV